MQSDTKLNWFYLQKKSLSWNPYLCITKVTVVGLLKKIQITMDSWNTQSQPL